ncbi:thioredoxin family protein [Candidatus Acetothermia bacterium]|jgi:glutaredoxin|nr:thioredoxin family protein [Candidatus Acetothermia bacterium]
MKKKIEVFTADCPLCKETLNLVRQKACPECEILEQRCSGDECCEPAKGYGIKAVPTIVVNGKTRFVGKPSLAEVKSLFA